MASGINYRRARAPPDLALFAPPAWLNDRALHFAMKLLEDDSRCSGSCSIQRYAFLMLQCDFDDEDEVSDLRRGLVFPGSDRVLATVISDASTLHVGGGSHWSLLVYDVEADLARHYDSMGRSSNDARARQCAERLRVCFERSTVAFETIETPRQTKRL